MFQPHNELTLTNWKTALPAGLQAIAGGQTEFDLSAVTAVDSIAVTMMLAWQRAAQVKGVNLNFVATPGNLQSLVNLYGMTGLFQFTTAPA